MKMLCVVLLLYLASTQLVFCTYTCPPSSDATAIKRLKSNLFCNYDPQERPVKDKNSAVIVLTQLFLNHLTFVESQNKLDITAFLYLQWEDQFLQWNSTLYEIEHLNIPATQFWFPDFFIIGNDIKRHDLARDTSCILQNNGILECFPQLNTQVYCNQDLSRWPYDQHKCDLELSFNKYPLNELQLDPLLEYFNQDLKYKDNSWKFLSATDKLNIYHGAANFSEIIYTFELRRHAGLFATTVVAPAFVLAAMTLVSFWIHGVATRTCICSTSFVGNLIILLYIGFRVVAAGDATPDIAFYYRDALILTLVSLVITTSVERAREQNIKFEAPGWLVNVFAWLRGTGGRAGQILLGDDDVQMTLSREKGKNASQCVSYMTLIERTSFLALLITYIVMLLDLLP